MVKYLDLDLHFGTQRRSSTIHLESFLTITLIVQCRFRGLPSKCFWITVQIPCFCVCLHSSDVIHVWSCSIHLQIHSPCGTIVFLPCLSPIITQTCQRGVGDCNGWSFSSSDSGAVLLSHQSAVCRLSNLCRPPGAWRTNPYTLVKMISLSSRASLPAGEL